MTQHYRFLILLMFIYTPALYAPEIQDTRTKKLLPKAPQIFPPDGAPSYKKPRRVWRAKSERQAPPPPDQLSSLPDQALSLPELVKESSSIPLEDLDNWPLLNQQSAMKDAFCAPDQVPDEAQKQLCSRERLPKNSIFLSIITEVSSVHAHKLEDPGKQKKGFKLDDNEACWLPNSSDCFFGELLLETGDYTRVRVRLDAKNLAQPIFPIEIIGPDPSVHPRAPLCIQDMTGKYFPAFFRK